MPRSREPFCFLHLMKHYSAIAIGRRSLAGWNSSASFRAGMAFSFLSFSTTGTSARRGAGRRSRPMIRPTRGSTEHPALPRPTGSRLGCRPGTRLNQAEPRESCGRIYLAVMQDRGQA